MFTFDVKHTTYEKKKILCELKKSLFTRKEKLTRFWKNKIFCFNCAKEEKKDLKNLSMDYFFTISVIPSPKLQQ